MVVQPPKAPPPARRRPVASRTRVAPTCAATDDIGLSADAKERLFQGFDAFQAAHRTDPSGGEARGDLAAAGPAPKVADAGVKACPAPKPK